MVQPKGVIEERYIRRNTAEPFYLSVSKDLVAGHESIHKFGANFQIDGNTDPETIWTGGGLYPWSALNTAQVLYAISTSTSDTNEMTIEGLDSDYNKITEVITLNGTTAVSTTNQFKRVYRMIYNHTAENVGTITLRTGSGTGTVVAQIDIGYSQTLMAIYTIPAGYTGYILQLGASVNKNEDVQIAMYQREFNQAFKIFHLSELYQESYSMNFPIPIKFEQKTDLEIRASEVETNGTRVTATFDLLLVKEDSTGY